MKNDPRNRPLRESLSLVQPTPIELELGLEDALSDDPPEARGSRSRAEGPDSQTAAGTPTELEQHLSDCHSVSDELDALRDFDRMLQRGFNDISRTTPELDDERFLALLRGLSDEPDLRLGRRFRRSTRMVLLVTFLLLSIVALYALVALSLRLVSH